MQSRIELSHNHAIKRQNLPRGYFKKRKFESKEPPDIAKIKTKKNCSSSVFSFVNMKKVEKIFIVLLFCYLTEINEKASALETDSDFGLSVKNLKTTATPFMNNGSGSEFY
jgi:hypothetical protein